MNIQDWFPLGLTGLLSFHHEMIITISLVNIHYLIDTKIEEIEIFFSLW